MRFSEAMNFNEASVCRSVRNSSGNNSSSKMKKKKRFSDEQIRSLEVMFGSEAKPDPGLKQQLAAELGLQPRQVAIWFQNRRARLKPKQIEREYDNLKASYDALAVKFESLKKENQSLTVQLRTFVEKFERVVKMERSGGMNDDLNISGTTEQGACQQPQKHQHMDEYQAEGHHIDQDQKMRVMEQQQQQVSNLPMDQMMYIPATSSANSWSSEYSCFLDQSSCGSSAQQWWEFW